MKVLGLVVSCWLLVRVCLSFWHFAVSASLKRKVTSDSTNEISPFGLLLNVTV